MGFFDRLGKNGRRFVAENEYEDNLAEQTAMTPRTLEILRGHGVNEQTELRLEFFFYTDAIDKALGLAEKLAQRGYSVDYGPSAGDRKVFAVTGWTDRMPMDESTVLTWTRLMCRLGYEHDCDFDGWGTDPHQD